MTFGSRASRVSLTALGALIVLSLSACAHKDPTAPCVAGPAWGAAFAAYLAGCGPMRPVN
jgi:hypothetical protein